jgi:hypothetical protein
LFLVAAKIMMMKVDANVAEREIGAVQKGASADFGVLAFTRPGWTAR